MPTKTKTAFADWTQDKNTRLFLRTKANAQAIVFKRKGAGDLMRSIMKGAPAAVVDAAVAKAEGEGEDGDIVSTFTLSTKRLDSYEDTVNPDGWDTDDFKDNPVVLFAHNSWAPPVGKDIGHWVEPGVALKGTTMFTSEKLYAFGAMIGRMVKSRFLNAVSVGFDPKEWVETDRGNGWFGGYDFIKQVLREYSVVPIPANMDALADKGARKAAGIDDATLIDWCERSIEGAGGLVLPPGVARRLRSGVVGQRIVLAGVPMVRAEGEDEEAKPNDGEGEAPVEGEGEATPQDEEAKADDDAAGMCPACGYEAPAADFKVKPESDSKEEIPEDEPSGEGAPVEGEGEAEDEEQEDKAAPRGGRDTASKSRQDDPAVSAFEAELIRATLQGTAVVSDEEFIEATGRLPD